MALNKNDAFLLLSARQSTIRKDELFVYRKRKGISIYGLGIMVILGIFVGVINFGSKYIINNTNISFESKLWVPFFQCIASIFAILSGFILITVLNRFIQLRDHISAELNCIEAMRDSLLLIKSNNNNILIKNKFKQLLFEYVHTLWIDEWFNLQKDTKKHAKDLNSDTNTELINIYKYLSNLQKNSNEKDQFGLNVILKNLDLLSKTRTERILLS